MWSNGHTCIKINEALENAEWMLQMSIGEVNVLKPRISDHSPLSLDLGRDCKNSYKTFQFSNYLVEHLEFINKVRTA